MGECGDVDRGADRRGHLDRIRHPRLSRPAGRVDSRSRPSACPIFTNTCRIRDRKLSWQGRANHPAWQSWPNPGHRALVALERRGKLRALVTQNIDGLHQAGAGSVRVIEVHGTMRDVICMACGRRGPAGPVLDRVRAGEADPPCQMCGGILKSATISFGQALVGGD